MNAFKAATYALATLGALAVLTVTLGGAGASPAPPCGLQVHLQGPSAVVAGQPVTLRAILSVSGTNCHVAFAHFAYQNLPTNVPGLTGSPVTFVAESIGLFHPIVVATTNYGTVAGVTSLYVLPPN